MTLKAGRRVQHSRKKQIQDLLTAFDGFREQLGDLAGWADYADKRKLGPPELHVDPDGKSFLAPVDVESIWSEFDGSRVHVSPSYVGYDATITKNGDGVKVSFGDNDHSESFPSLRERLEEIKSDFEFDVSLGVMHGGRAWGADRIKTLLDDSPNIPEGATVTARIIDVKHWGDDLSHLPLDDRLKILNSEVKNAISDVAGVLPASGMRVNSLKQMERAHRRFANLDGSGGLFVKAIETGGIMPDSNFIELGKAVERSDSLWAVVKSISISLDANKNEEATTVLRDSVDGLDDSDDFRAYKSGDAAPMMMRGQAIRRLMESALSALDDNDAKKAKGIIQRLLSRFRRGRDESPGEKPEKETSDKEGKAVLSAIKAIREEEYKGQPGVVVGGYMALFGNPKEKDIQGDYFTPETKTWIDIYSQVPALFHHGLDTDVGLEPMGHRVKAQVLDAGIWVEDWINKSNKYWSIVKPLLESERLFYSPGSASHLVKRSDGGELLSFPIVEDTLTPTPAQHRLMNRPVAQIKAVYDELGIDIPGDLLTTTDNEIDELKAALESDTLRVELAELEAKTS